MSSSVMSSVVLPALGVLVLLVCLVSLFLPFGAGLRSGMQKIRFPGVNLEVSVLALLILIGLVMSSIGVYLEVQDYNGRVAAAERRAAAAQQELDQAKHMQLKALVTLEGVPPSAMPKLSDVRSHYVSPGSEEPVEVTVTPGITENQLRIRLDNVNPTTSVQRLVVEDLTTGRMWTYENFVPFECAYALKKRT
jgi:hypothetical protein